MYEKLFVRHFVKSITIQINTGKRKLSLDYGSTTSMLSDFFAIMSKYMRRSN